MIEVLLVLLGIYIFVGIFIGAQFAYVMSHRDKLGGKILVYTAYCLLFAALWPFILGGLFRKR